MSEKTTYEIQAEHSAKASEILSEYHSVVDRAKALSSLPDGAYLDRLTDEQRIALLREQKAEIVRDPHEVASGKYAEELGRYHEELARRTSWLKGRLFKIEGPDGAAALSRTVTATEGELSAYLDVAIQAENTDLARAVFVAAERRGSGDLMARYFEEADPEARDLYQEWRETPPAEVLERQRDGVDKILPRPTRTPSKPRPREAWATRRRS